MKELREHDFLVVEVPAGTLHRRIHEQMSGIPAMRQSSARSVLYELQRLEKTGALRGDESLGQRIELLIFMLDGIEPSTVKALKKQLRIVTEFEQREIEKMLP